jgi:hypothetical protein
MQSFDKVLRLEPDHADARDNRALAIFSLQQWEHGFEALRECLQRFPPGSNHPSGIAKHIIRIVLGSTQDHVLWKQYLSRLVQLYAEVRSLTQLGTQLVGSLNGIPEQLLSSNILAAWSDAWHEAGDGYEELRIPLRIYDIGLRYLQTGDRKVLFDLVVEERKVLAEALGLAPEPE